MSSLEVKCISRGCASLVFVVIIKYSLSDVDLSPIPTSGKQFPQQFPNNPDVSPPRAVLFSEPRVNEKSLRSWIAVLGKAHT